MFESNKQNNNNYFYTDHLIYIPNIPFIKDDNFEPLQKNEIFVADIIASSAPNKTLISLKSKALNNSLKIALNTRILKIVQCAIDNKNNALVLGSYGCGNCGNDPKDVAESFKNVLIDKKFILLFQIKNTIIFSNQY